MAKGTTVRMWRRTIIVLLFLIVGGFGTIVVSLFRLQIIQGEELQTRAVNQQTQDTSLSAKRGTIYDCNMKVLATSADVCKVVLDPNYIRKELVQDQGKENIQDEIAERLAGILDLETADVRVLMEKQTYYAVVKTKVETRFSSSLIISDITLTEPLPPVCLALPTVKTRVSPEWRHPITTICQELRANW